jgi:hypothetical protein
LTDPNEQVRQRRRPIGLGRNPPAVDNEIAIAVIPFNLEFPEEGRPLAILQIK